MSSSPLPPLKSGMCRIRVLERLHPGLLVRVKCERPGQRRLAHRRSESGTPHAGLLSLLPPSAGAATLVLPSPAHLSPPPTLPRWLGPLHLPSLLRGHIASGPRHNPGSRNSPGLGPTHPLENFDEAQRLLQALPAQPQEQAVHLRRQSQQTVKAGRPGGKAWGFLFTLRGRERRNQTHSGHLGRQGLARVHRPGTRGLPAGAETCPRCGRGSPSRTCWRVGAQCKGSTPWPGGCVGRGGAGGGGLEAVGRPGSRLAGWVVGALLLALSEALSAALPRRLQKTPESDSNFCQTIWRTWQPSHVACDREPCSRPLLSPFSARRAP